MFFHDDAKAAVVDSFSMTSLSDLRTKECFSWRHLVDMEGTLKKV